MTRTKEIVEDEDPSRLELLPERDDARAEELPVGEEECIEAARERVRQRDRQGGGGGGGEMKRTGIGSERPKKRGEGREGGTKEKNRETDQRDDYTQCVWPC